MHGIESLATDHPEIIVLAILIATAIMAVWELNVSEHRRRAKLTQKERQAEDDQLSSWNSP